MSSPSLSSPPPPYSSSCHLASTPATTPSISPLPGVVTPEPAIPYHAARTDRERYCHGTGSFPRTAPDPGSQCPTGESRTTSHHPRTPSLAHRSPQEYLPQSLIGELRSIHQNYPLIDGRPHLIPKIYAGTPVVGPWPGEGPNRPITKIGRTLPPPQLILAAVSLPWVNINPCWVVQYRSGDGRGTFSNGFHQAAGRTRSGVLSNGNGYNVYTSQDQQKRPLAEAYQGGGSALAVRSMGLQTYHGLANGPPALRVGCVIMIGLGRRDMAGRSGKS